MAPSIGTFIKTVAPEIVEILALAGLDFLAVDAEHAPFGRRELDFMLLAGRGAGIPILVRVPDDRPTTIMHALDIGASGIIVPHVESAGQAEAIVRSARFSGGERGFSNAARFGKYGTTSIEQAVEIGDKAEILCQIESPGAVIAASDIAAVAGVSGLLIGRADLALSMGLRSIQLSEVTQAAREAIGAARQQGKIAGIVVGDASEIPEWRDAGANLFIVHHDQGLLRQAATAMVAKAKSALV